ncbi:MAG TPA: 4-hydroxy-3-methylbut-2-en-1-yl diphosphate synthase, partial [Planctomycetes bacterium]|nr:4-hydroxy-3-methylbut-2-en-1-yl diphosphate synthase [Planctomycetota bacterium]
MTIQRNPTRPVRIGTVAIGDGAAIAVQSMTATRTQDIDATVTQIRDLVDAGADIVRVAIDSQKDAEALIEIRSQVEGNLS